MSPLTIRCLKAAFLALAGGILLGALFAINRPLGAMLRPLHAELNLWGWTTLLIYGMAYHMLPRFAGRPLRRQRAAELQSWLAIGGVLLACLGWALLPWLPEAGRSLMALGGVVQLAAALVFALLAAEVLRPR
jgi:Na+/proline symporter